jgi:hypothetical protein
METIMRTHLMLVMLFVTTLATLSIAQNIVIPNADTLSVQQKKPFGVSLNLGGPAVSSISAVYYINRVVKAEIGLGSMFCAGMTFHCRNDIFNDGWTAYAGAYFERVYRMGWENDPDVHENSVYLPIGMQYLTRGGFSFAAEVAYQNSPILHRNMWGAIKFGLQL